MSGRKIIYRPPRPLGDPFRAAPSKDAAFPRDGDAAKPPSAQQPAAAPADGPYVLPPGGATAGQIPLASPNSQSPAAQSAGRAQPPSLGGAPVFTKPGGGPVGGPRVAPATVSARKARNALIAGVVSLLFLHIPLGPIAIVLGIQAMRAGERRTGAWAIATGVGGTLVGILGVVLWATGNLPNLDRFMQDDAK